MGKGILVCGCNGSGKTTLGRALAAELGYSFIDIEDCYFPKDSAGYGYDRPHTREEAEQLLAEKIAESGSFVLAAVKGNFGHGIPALFGAVVLVSVPKEIRMRRVRQRSFQKFGARMLPGGDLYEKEEAFFRMVESRGEEDVESWLRSVSCRVIRVDGTLPIGENVLKIAGILREEP